jgi:hypothetical protein
VSACPKCGDGPGKFGGVVVWCKCSGWIADPVRDYQLKLATGQVVTWQGSSEIDAAKRYVDCHRDAVVVATRPVRHGLFIGAPETES